MCFSQNRDLPRGTPSLEKSAARIRRCLNSWESDLRAELARYSPDMYQDRHQEVSINSLLEVKGCPKTTCWTSDGPQRADLGTVSLSFYAPSAHAGPPQRHSSASETSVHMSMPQELLRGLEVAGVQIAHEDLDHVPHATRCRKGC